jgi:subtilisin-like proprotein convertase family protein
VLFRSAYASLTAAFADAALNGLACPCNFELQAAYVSSVETYPLNVPFVGAGAGTSITVRPELGATNLSITNGTANTLVFNGSSFTTFDGRPGGVGVVRQLTIANTATGFSAANFVGNVTNCGLTYVNIQGVTTGTTSGVVSLGNATSIAGLTNLSITNSRFFEGATTPQQYIFSANATANSWTNMTVTNNTFEDWFSAAGATNAINIAGGNRGWNISNNSFYQTATRTYTTANTHNIILVSTTTPASGGNTISNNNFGGNDALMTGYYTLNGAIASRLNVINASGNTSFANNTISGNTIKNFNLSTTSGATTSPGLFCGILAAGTTNNFNITNNIIGSNTNSDSIMVTTTTTGGISYGISVTATGANTVNGNQVGGMKMYGSSATISTSFVGLNIAAGTANTVNSNTVGSLTIPSNIRTNLSTGATAGRMDGIFVAGTTHTVTNNTVGGLSNFYSGTGTGAVRGIFINTGTANVSNNTVSNLATFANHTSAGSTASISGIFNFTTANGQVISNNTVSNLYNFASSATNTVILGIGYNTTATLGLDNLIHRNKVSNLAAPLSTGAPVVIGIDVQVGNVRAYNNFIDLGLNGLSASITAPNSFIGINKSTTASGRFLFNSVRIAGTGVSGGSTNSFAFRRTSVGATDTVKANVFVNIRSNGTSTGKHYAISLNNNTTITLDRNVYFGNGTGYVFGSYLAADVTSLSAWSATTSNDVNSFFADPNFISATDLHINGATPNIVESRASGVTSIITDIDGDTRPGPIGSVNGGGTDPDIGADEVDAFPVTTDLGISLLVKPLTSGCHTTPDSVIVRLRNYASTSTINFALDNVTINSSVTGPNPVVFPTIVINSGTLAGGATLDVVVGLNYVMNALGTYTFNASAVTPLDFINSNDAMSPVNITIAGGTSDANQDDICAFGNVTLTNLGATAGGSMQWQISQNGLIWTNIPGATTNPYTYVDASTSPDTLFFRSISCGADSSNRDSVIINYVVPANASDTSRCGPGFLDLYAAGSGTLGWYDAPTGGTLLDTGVVYTPFLAVTDTFYVQNSSGGSGATQLNIMPLAGGNGCGGGNMFNVAPNTNIDITGIIANLGATAGTPVNVNIYYKTGNYQTFELTAAAWTLHQTVSVIAAGPNNPTLLNINPLNFAGGSPYAIFVNADMDYTNVAGPTNFSNADLTVTVGAGLCGQFTGLNANRGFNGSLIYSAGCPAARTPVIATITAAAPMSAVAVSGGVTCDNEIDSLVITSPNTSYSYLWTPNTGLADSTALITAANPLTTTTYYLAAIDTAGCQAFDTVTIAVNASPLINLLSSDSVICYGDTANLFVANGPFFYTDSVDVTVPDANPTGINSNPITASGVTGSMISTTIDSVCFNMTHTWDSDMDIYLVAPSGTQMLLVEGEGGSGDNFVSTCFSPNATVPIVGALAPLTGTFIPEDPLGFGVFNGENANGNWSLFMADGAGGDVGVLQDWSIWFSGAGYSYSWNSSGGPLTDTAASIFVNPLVTTTYYLTATDTINGCEKVDTVVLAVYDQLLLNPYASPVIACANGGDTLVANATGGMGNYSFAWSDGLGSNDTATVFAIPFDVMIGVTVTDGCGTLTDSVLIDIAAPIVITSTDTAYCGPGSGFVLSSDVVGGNGVNTYSWTGGSVADTSVTGLVSTTTSYTVTVTDGCGSTDTDVSTVTINPLPVANLGADIVQVNPPAVLDAGAGFSSYLWSTSATSQTISVNANGQYIVTVTNSFGCSDSDTIQVTFTAGINNPDGTTATVSYYPNPSNGILNMNIQGFMGKELKMDVMDLEGRIIRNFVFGEVTESYVTQMDLSTLRAGTYMVVLYSGGDTYTHRIVITTNY